MKRKTTTNKPKEFIISEAELSKPEMGVMPNIPNVVNNTKKGKNTIKLERQLTQTPAVMGWLITFFRVFKKIYTHIIKWQGWII